MSYSDKYLANDTSKDIIQIDTDDQLYELCKQENNFRIDLISHVAKHILTYNKKHEDIPIYILAEKIVDERRIHEFDIKLTPVNIFNPSGVFQFIDNE